MKVSLKNVARSLYVVAFGHKLKSPEIEEKKKWARKISLKTLSFYNSVKAQMRHCVCYDRTSEN